jgi:hypothetical protein
MRSILILALLLIPLPASANEYYTWRDEEGRLHIADKPPASTAQEVESHRYDPGQSSPAFQRYTHPRSSKASVEPSSDSTGHRHPSVLIDPLKVRIEEERLEERILHHEEMKNRSSNELGISKYRTGAYTNDKLRQNRDQHQKEIDKYRRMLIELKRDPLYYFRKYGKKTLK